jgi:hypothetical protein
LQALGVTDLKAALDPVLIASKGALWLGGDRDRIGIDFESRDAEPVEMRDPGCGEKPVRVLGQTSDQRAGKGTLTHIGQCLGVSIT